MMKIINIISGWMGYADSSKLVKGAFHPDFAEQIAPISVVFSCVAYYFYLSFGIQLPVFIGVIALFVIEMRTGIKVSKLQGRANGWKSDLAQKGFGKFCLYWTGIGVIHLFDLYIPTEELFYFFEFDLYKWIHFLIYNYVILIYIGSIVENLIHLGYDEKRRIGWIVRLIAKIYRIKIDKLIDNK